MKRSNECSSIANYLATGLSTVHDNTLLMLKSFFRWRKIAIFKGNKAKSFTST